MATQNQLDDFAFNVSELSYCKRKKVGAVIVWNREYYIQRNIF